jgi:hypothetical protein
MNFLKSKKPIAKVTVGVTTGTIVGLITSIFMIVFHKSLSPDVIAILPMAIGVLGHFLGSYLTPYIPAIDEIIAYVRALLANVPPVTIPGAMNAEERRSHSF